MTFIGAMAARFMMLIAVIGSISVLFYFYILDHKTLWYNNASRSPNLAWDFANRRNIIITKDPGLQVGIIGQIFNHHPGVFYMDEPLYPLEMFKTLNYTRAEEYNGQVRAFLDNLFNCRFYGYKDYLTFLSHPGLTSPRYRLASKTLSSPPLCYNHMENYTTEEEYSSNCPLLNDKWVSRVCSRKAHKVISVAPKRAPGGRLKGLLQILTSEAMNTRIFNVVTDPRGDVWATRLRDGGQSLERHAQEVCHAIESDINSSVALPVHNSAQYSVVRYEDVMRNVSSAAQEVIKNADIYFLSDVREWVRDRAELWIRGHSKYISAGYKDWRSSMDLQQVLMIQRYCSYAMRMLGYGPISSVEQLRNLEQSLLITPRLEFVMRI